MDYCRYSASPVGRHVLALHGIVATAWPANDALCSVLQIINHIQDCADDDHVGNFDRFPKARFHLQERELSYATGRYMRYPRLAHSFEVEDICGIVRLNYARRVMFYDGDAELAPGITVHAVGGHSDGLQFVRVKTRRGYVVVASDVTHFYENMASQRPFTTALHIGKMLEGFDRLLQMAPDEDHIVPGHDPLVMKLYPAPSAELEGIAVRLDVAPSGVAPRRADYSSPH